MEANRFCSARKAAWQSEQDLRCWRSSGVGAPEAAAAVSADWKCLHGIAVSPLVVYEQKIIWTSPYRLEVLTSRQLLRCRSLRLRTAARPFGIFQGVHRRRR